MLEQVLVLRLVAGKVHDVAVKSPTPLGHGQEVRGLLLLQSRLGTIVDEVVEHCELRLRDLGDRLGELGFDRSGERRQLAPTGRDVPELPGQPVNDSVGRPSKVEEQRGAEARR
jgi:hypothetical protein